MFAKERIDIKSHQRVEVGLGYAIIAPPGKVIQIFSEPELLGRGLSVITSMVIPGNEIKIVISNDGDFDTFLDNGECVARFVFIKLRANISITPISSKRFPDRDEPDNIKHMRLDKEPANQDDDDDFLAPFLIDVPEGEIK